MDTVAIGRVGSPSGLKGEFRINLYAERSDNLKEGKVLLLKRAGKKSGAAASPEGAGRHGVCADAGKASHIGLCTSDAGRAGCSGSSETAFEAFTVEHVRYQKERPVVKLRGIDDRTAAEALCGMEVSIEAEALEPLPEGEHYVRNLIGCRVIDIAVVGNDPKEDIAATQSEDSDSGKESASAERSEDNASEMGSTPAAMNECSAQKKESAAALKHSGREIGRLRDVIQNTAQSILEVETEGGRTVLIPAVDAFIRDIDEEARIITVELIPGF